jgi:hypothetical protein
LSVLQIRGPQYFHFAKTISLVFDVDQQISCCLTGSMASGRRR